MAATPPFDSIESLALSDLDGQITDYDTLLLAYMTILGYSDTLKDDLKDMPKGKKSSGDEDPAQDILNNAMAQAKVIEAFVLATVQQAIEDSGP